jgi:hypothetical protein
MAVLPCARCFHLITDLRDLIPFEHTEPLILIVMQVTRDTALIAIAVLHYEEVAARIGGRNLERGWT